jgi:hypothetical protein
MPDPTTRPEATATPEAFDIDKALNTKGFLEFLGKHPDAAEFDMKDEGEMQERFETFEKKETVKSDLQKIFVDNIEKEMGIKLSPADKEAIEAEIERRSVESPEDIHRQEQELADFAQANRDMNDAWEELNTLGYFEADDVIGDFKTKIDALSKEKDAIGLVKNYTGFIGNGRLIADILFTSPRRANSLMQNVIDTRDKVEKRYGTQDKKQLEGFETSIEAQIADHNETIAKITEVAGKYTLAQKGFTELQKNLLGDMAGFTAFTEIIKQKAQAALSEMMAKGTLSSFDKAQAHLEQLRTARESSLTGVDPLEGMDEEMFQQMLDAAAEEKVKDHITEAVLDAKMGNNALSNLEKSLSAYTTKENIGSKDADESKQFVIDTITEIRDEMGDNEEARIKKLMLARVLVKLQA